MFVKGLAQCLATWQELHECELLIFLMEEYLELFIQTPQKLSHLKLMF